MIHWISITDCLLHNWLQIPEILIVIVSMILFISTCKRDNIVQGWSFCVSIWKSSIAGSLPAPRRSFGSSRNVCVRGYIAGKTSLNTVKVRADQHTNSPVWYWPYISLRNWLREFDKRSKHFPFGNYYINSHNPFSLWCAEIIRRKLMLITLGTDSLLSEICKRDLFHRDFTLGDHTTCYDVGKSH